MGRQVLPTLFRGQKLFFYFFMHFVEKFVFVSDEIYSVDEIEFHLGCFVDEIYILSWTKSIL